eukprot:scaffold2407_cov57-Cyclotella_meneghiniana.AAC.3
MAASDSELLRRLPCPEPEWFCRATTSTSAALTADRVLKSTPSPQTKPFVAVTSLLTGHWASDCNKGLE